MPCKEEFEKYWDDCCRKRQVIEFCERLPYHPHYLHNGYEMVLTSMHLDGSWDIGDAKLFLRPISTITEEEEGKISDLGFSVFREQNTIESYYGIDLDYRPVLGGLNTHEFNSVLRYLRSIHVDYSGMIDDNLAIPVEKGKYNPYKLKLYTEV